MWMMNGPRKVQPKSGNFIAADFVTILSWCEYAWNEVKKETILSGVKKCYMSADPGLEFDVEPVPEKMEIEEDNIDQLLHKVGLVDIHHYCHNHLLHFHMVLKLSNNAIFLLSNYIHGIHLE